MTTIALLKLPPQEGACALTHFTSVIHERKEQEVLVDYPTGLNTRERKWVPAATPVLVDVKVGPGNADSTLVGFVSVEPIWGGVDRPNVGGWAVKPKHVERLVRAIKAGVVCTNPVVKTDVNGKTYVDCQHTVMGKYLNADLKKLGF